MPFPRVLALALLLAATLTAGPTYRDALDLYKAQRYHEAKSAFQTLATAEPANPKYRYFLGMTAMRLRNYDDAILHLEQATQLAPDNGDYFGELGNAYGKALRRAGVFSQMSLARKCRAALERAAELKPDNLEIREGLIEFYRDAPGFLGGGMDKAYAQAEAIRQRDPHRGTFVFVDLYTRVQRYADAFGVVLELLQREPDYYLGHYTMGRLAAESGERLDAGEKHLLRSLELPPANGDPGHAFVFLRLGQIAERQENPTSARIAYETALKLDPNFQAAADALAKLK